MPSKQKTIIEERLEKKIILKKVPKNAAEITAAYLLHFNKWLLERRGEISSTVRRSFVLIKKLEKNA